MLILKAINICLAVGSTGMQLGTAKALILHEIPTHLLYSPGFGFVCMQIGQF